MKDLEPGFPRQKIPKKKTGYLKRMSDKTREKLPLRKQVVDETHVRSGGRCEAWWIAPDVKCSRGVETDEKLPRGRSGGISQYDASETQSLCRKCHTVKGLEVAASERLGLYGKQGLSKHIPFDEEQHVKDKDTFSRAKARLNFG